MPQKTQFPPDAIVGEWCTQPEKNRPPGRIRFARDADGTYRGTLTWSAQMKKKDVHNKDPKLRERSLVGITLTWNLRYRDGEYVDGYIYNPEDGGTYRLRAEVQTEESLKVHGYLGIALFGQDRIWSRFHP